MNLKKWLKENYKVSIVCVIYWIIVIYILFYTDSVYFYILLIVAGVVTVGASIGIIIIEYQIRKNDKKEIENE